MIYPFPQARTAPVKPAVTHNVGSLRLAAYPFPVAEQTVRVHETDPQIAFMLAALERLEMINSTNEVTHGKPTQTD